MKKNNTQDNGELKGQNCRNVCTLQHVTGTPERRDLLFHVFRYDSLGLGGTLDDTITPAEPVRYTIDVATGAVTRTRLLTGYHVEFPVVPAHLMTRASKFTYMTGNVAGSRCDGVRCEPETPLKTSSQLYDHL